MRPFYHAVFAIDSKVIIRTARVVLSLSCSEPRPFILNAPPLSKEERQQKTPRRHLRTPHGGGLHVAARKRRSVLPARSGAGDEFGGETELGSADALNDREVGTALQA